MEPYKRNVGGGSGGGDDINEYITSNDGAVTISGNNVDVLCMPPMPPTEAGPTVITIAADDFTGTGGEVNINGTKGVRISAGPPALPPVASDSTNGVEIATGEMQNVTLQRGLVQGVDQMIQMTPSGITVDAGTMPVTIQSLTQITLSVAGGVSTITLTPEGITIQGVLVQIN